jgi:hypothetical protein
MSGKENYTKNGRRKFVFTIIFSLKWFMNRKQEKKSVFRLFSFSFLLWCVCVYIYEWMNIQHGGCSLWLWEAFFCMNVCMYIFSVDVVHYHNFYSAKWMYRAKMMISHWYVNKLFLIILSSIKFMQMYNPSYHIMYHFPSQEYIISKSV